ncbi:MAG: secretion protein HlyD [Armatimonadetes bacterium]|jgi:RND family efflux transporter MFP subunit|nr:secretion protein HlyD [Armatimonadota bacterium]
MSVAREQPRARNFPVWIIAALVAALLIGFGAWAFFRSRPASATVTRRDLVAAVPLKGDVVAPPTERADIYSPFKAPVAKVYATVGASVKRGDVLAELSVPNAQEAYQQARAQVQAAETAYANAERQYDAPVAAARQELRTAGAAERAARTAPSVTVTTETGDAAVTVPAQPAADLSALTSARMTAEQSVAQAEAAKTAALAVYKQQLDTAREYFDQAKSGRKMGMVRSPINGTVLALNAQAGQMAGEDRKTPIAIVVDLDELEIQGEIPAESASVVKAGMPVSVTVAEVPNEQFEGRVHSITTRPGGLLKNKTEYLAVLHLKNPKGLVKPGMKAAAAVELKELKDVLAVPNDAIQKDSSGRPMINVMVNGKWDQRLVEIGLSDGHYTEVKSGLKEGEVVQVKPDLL